MAARDDAAVRAEPGRRRARAGSGGRAEERYGGDGRARGRDGERSAVAGSGRRGACARRAGGREPAGRRVDRVHGGRGAGAAGRCGTAADPGEPAERAGAAGRGRVGGDGCRAGPARRGRCARGFHRDGVRGEPDGSGRPAGHARGDGPGGGGGDRARGRAGDRRGGAHDRRTDRGAAHHAAADRARRGPGGDRPRAAPDMAVPPLRRSWSGLIFGFLIAALVVAGFAVLSIVSPGGASGWRKPGTLILDKGTGTSFVLAGGRLRPVLNYASARLLLGEKLTVDSVPSKSLKNVPRGGPVGISGAPDSLPDPEGGDRAWLACASSAGSKPALSLLIGADADERPLSTRQAALVRTSDGTTYLVTGGRRLRVTAPWATRALGVSDDAAIGVRDAWVNTLPAGPDLPPPATPGIGN